jgi:hypothetical protein
VGISPECRNHAKGEALSVQAEVTRAAEQFDDVVDDAFGGHVEVPVEVGGCEFGLGADE